MFSTHNQPVNPKPQVKTTVMQTRNQYPHTVVTRPSPPKKLSK